MDVIAKFDDPRRQGRRRRRLRTISTFPTLLTLGNLLCGFAAIHFCLRAMFNVGAGIPDDLSRTLSSGLMERALPSYLCISAFLVFGGLFFDMLDGRVARLTRNTSTFGGQIDSLADMVTFGVAPAILVVALAYCLAVRDAVRQPHRSFYGLASPGAGAVLASLVLLREHSSGVRAIVLVRLLPVITLLVGLLMVSRFRYVHLANAYLKGRRPFWQVVLGAIVVIIFLWQPAPALALIACGYATTGPVASLLRWLRLRGRGEFSHQPSERAPQSDSTRKQA